MLSAAAGCLGFILGALAGAALGVGLGLLWTTAFHTSCFEGYCGMLVFFTFMPIGAILGALIGAIALAMLARPRLNGSSRTSGDGVARGEQDERP